jgi:hypothetical protein
MKDFAKVRLLKGVSVLTLRVLTEGNMNFVYLEFKSEKQPHGCLPETPPRDLAKAAKPIFYIGSRLLKAHSPSPLPGAKVRHAIDSRALDVNHNSRSV